jgi:HAD superfamily 5'-nucleotidase-like hydrolase
MENLNSNSDNVIDILEKELLEKKFIDKPIDREILSKVDVIGFDIDHTLCIYNTEAMVELLYKSFSKYLVEYKNYPKDILIYSNDSDVDLKEKESNLKFNELFVHKYSNTEVVLDFINGNAISIDENKLVIKGYHGTDELSEEKLQEVYGKSKEFAEFNFETRGANYQVILGNFEYHVIPLYLICVHLYDNGHMKNLDRINNYKVIYDDILDALIFNYNLYDSETNTVKSIRETGFFFPEFTSKPEKYIYDYSAKEMLKHLKSKGIGVFFATNSFFEFADFIMRHIIGEDYLDYFDLGIFYAKKPGFFHEGCDAEGYFPDLKISDNKTRPGIKSADLKDENIFYKLINKKTIIEGSYKIVENFYQISKNKENLKFIYVGDNFYSDCLHPAKLSNWESVAVHDHISTGFIGNKPLDFKKFWRVEDSITNFGDNKHGIFYSKQLREQTLFTVSNVDTLKFLK